MKTADTATEDMAVGGKLLKRTARVTVEYGAELSKAEHAKKLTKPDEVMSQAVEGKATTSGVTAPTAAAAMDHAAKTTSRGSSTTVPPTGKDQAVLIGVSRGADSKVAVDGVQLADQVQDSSTPSLKLPKELEHLQHFQHPLNFGGVIPGVYRSSFPKTEDYPFLKQLGLKTVVTLVQKDFPAEYQPFLKENGIKHHVFDMAGTKKEAIPIQTMNTIIRLVLNSRNHPLLIHCNHGRHRTGCVVGIIRKMGGVNLPSILDEYRTFAEPKIRDCDIEYITQFNPLQLVNLWTTERPFPFRFHHRFRPFRFRLFTTLTLFILVLWLYSGNELTTMTISDPQPSA